MGADFPICSSRKSRGVPIHVLYRCHIRLILLIRYCFNKKTFSNLMRGEIPLPIVLCLSVEKKQTRTTLAKQPKYLELMRCKCDIAVRKSVNGIVHVNIFSRLHLENLQKLRVKKRRITSKINAIEWLWKSNEGGREKVCGEAICDIDVNWCE